MADLSRPYEPGPAQFNQIENIFVYHAPIEGSGQTDRYAAIRAKLKDAAHFIACRTPVSREQSLCLTALQDAMMWANAAIACNETPENHPGL